MRQSLLNPWWNFSPREWNFSPRDSMTPTYEARNPYGTHATLAPHNLKNEPRGRERSWDVFLVDPAYATRVCHLCPRLRDNHTAICTECARRICFWLREVARNGLCIPCNVCGILSFDVFTHPDPVAVLRALNRYFKACVYRMLSTQPSLPSDPLRPLRRSPEAFAYRAFESHAYIRGPKGYHNLGHLQDTSSNPLRLPLHCWHTDVKSGCTVHHESHASTPYHWGKAARLDPATFEAHTDKGRTYYYVPSLQVCIPADEWDDQLDAGADALRAWLARRHIDLHAEIQYAPLTPGALTKSARKRHV